MNKHSDFQEEVKPVNQLLDKSCTHMPMKVQQDITQARQRALRKAAWQKNKRAERPNTPFNSAKWTNFSVAASMVVAVVSLVLVSYRPAEEIPILPQEMVELDIPLDDLPLLQELEFADWLVQQNIEVAS